MTDSQGALSLSWRAAAWLVIAASIGAMLGRILNVESAGGATPFLSANDRSRWCTVRALVDHGTYAIDEVVLRPDGGFDKRWATIDMVRHRGPDGREHYYSSKPPLFPTMLAGLYWLIKNTTGAEIQDETFYVARMMLVIVNVLPLLLMFVLLMHLADELGASDWGKLFVVTAAAWGTFLTTFAVTINNHLPAAVSVTAALAAALPVWRRDRKELWRFAVSGVFAAFAVANELPALSFFAMLGAGLLWKAPGRTLLAFAPAAAVVAAAFFGTNYVAHQSWRPPYMHRSDGATIVAVEAESLDQEALAAISSKLRGAGVEVPDDAVVREAVGDDRWMIWSPSQQRRYALVKRPSTIEVRQWDNWYEYERSYWTGGKKQGVDRGEPSRWVYAAHMLAGHHGVFSLTPIWIFSVAGVVMMLARGEEKLRGLGLMILTLSVVCATFYVMRDLKDRNYGGVSCGFRWLFWLIPLWLLALIPAMDKLATRRMGRVIAGAFLLISVLSATYASMNPWSQPWLFDYWTYVGWIEY